MKHLRYYFLPTLFAFFGLVFVCIVSCKNKCGSTTCQNGGTCTDNLCVCPTGYSGNSCQTGWSDACIGTYKCTRSACNPALANVSQWVTAVTKDATNGGYTIDMSNFQNSNTTIVATIDSAQNIVIKPAAGSFGIDASGTYSNGTITLQYSESSVNGPEYRCTMTMVKE